MSSILISIFGISSIASAFYNQDALVTILLVLTIYIGYLLFLYRSIKFFILKEEDVKKRNCNCINKIIHFYFKLHKYIAAIIITPIIFILFILTIIFPLIIGDETAETKLTQIISESIRYKIEHVGFVKDDKYNYVLYPLKAKTCRILIDDPKAKEKIDLYNNSDIDLFNCYPFSRTLKKAIYNTLENKKNKLFNTNNGSHEELLKIYKV